MHRDRPATYPKGGNARFLNFARLVSHQGARERIQARSVHFNKRNKYAALFGTT